MDMVHLPAVLFQLTHLQSLDLSCNRLKHLHEGLSALTALQELNLQDAIYHMDPGIKESQLNFLMAVTSLKKLDLNHNLLRALPDTLSRLTGLECLDLGSNILHSLPETVRGLSNLQFLCVTKNSLRTLPEGLTDLVSLQYLDISWNSLKTLPSNLGALQITAPYHALQ